TAAQTAGAITRYVGIIVYASLYANHPWRDNGLGLFDFMSGGWPRYRTWQDAWFNILAYLPLGFLLTLSPTHRPSPWARVAIPLALGFALSASMEALQTFIPGRVSSSLDLFFNTLGTLSGAYYRSSAAPIYWLPPVASVNDSVSADSARKPG
ncbi:MAG: VanZ family protein, partial [Fluviibacter sp.]